MPKITYTWDPVNDCLIDERDDSGNVIASYSYEPGRPGRLLSEHRQGVTRHHHYDAQGNTRVLTDDTGTVTDQFIYDAWGNEIARTGTTPTRFRWHGRFGVQLDLSTAQMFWLSAEYDASLGRFLNGTMARASIPLQAFLRGMRDDPPGEPQTISAKKTLPCVEPNNEGCNCLGDDCDFELKAVFERGLDQQTNRLCLTQTPGEPLPPPAPQPDGRLCTSEINRTTGGKDNFTLILRDGTRCEFTDKIMPPDAPFPPNWDLLPPACRDVIDSQPPSIPGQGGCYGISEKVKGIEVDFTIEIFCGCDLYRTSDTLRLKGKL